MITVTRRFWFSYGHRVFMHEGQCANLHGHNATLLVTVTGSKLDQQGRVIDFGELKRRIDPWLQTNWDHAFLWYDKDPVGRYLFKWDLGIELGEYSPSPVQKEIMGMRNYRCMFNPTVEEMCNYLATKIIPTLLNGTAISVVNVTMYETDNCSASVEV